MREARLFYAAEGCRLMETCTVPEFLEHVERRFAAVSTAAMRYLDVRRCLPWHIFPLAANRRVFYLSAVVSYTLRADCSLYVLTEVSNYGDACPPNCG
jgi:hypothetical protein